MDIPKFQNLTGEKVHYQFKRGLAHADKYLNEILKCYENNEKFYLVALYTPTKFSLNLNDINQFLLLKWLQDVFKVPLIIHVNDNHRFLKDFINIKEFPDLDMVKNIALTNFSHLFNSKLSRKQISNLISDKGGCIKEDFRMKYVEILTINCMKEIISIGFDSEQTFLCRNLEYIGKEPAYFESIITLGSKITFTQSISCFNVDYSDDVETISLSSKDMAAIFPCSYPHILENPINIRGIVLNLDVRKMEMCRKLACEMHWFIPASIKSEPLPALHGNGIMDSYGVNSAIFFNDDPRRVEKKINKFAYSGGRDTIEEHEKYGGNCYKDISFQYLKYFMEDPKKLEDIREKYKSGKLLTGQLKQETIDVINHLLNELQNNYKNVSNELLNLFTAIRLLSFGKSTKIPDYVYEEKASEEIIDNFNKEMKELEMNRQKIKKKTTEESSKEIEELEPVERKLEKETGDVATEESRKEIEELEPVERKLGKETGDVVTPWEVQGDVDTGIDYDKLVEKYGSSKIGPDLIERFEKVTGKKAHHLLRRGMFYSHRDFNEILDSYEKGEQFFLYTGRGPSSDALHLGHLIPFIFTKWLQDVFDVPLVIQLTDDEKCLMRNISIEDVTRMAIENVKDIIAVGFDHRKTFIFRDFQYIGQESAFYKTALRVGSKVNFNSMKAIFGFTERDSVEKIAFPPVQAATSFSTSFPAIFGDNHRIRSLIPCAIDQDPYFRMTRDVAPRLNLPKPALILSKFFPSLQGNQTKMNASDPKSAIFMTDSPEQIADKINNHTFTISEERKKTLSLEEITKFDICYQYLTFFMENQTKLNNIKKGLGNGTVSNDQLKKELISILTPIVAAHKEKRSEITDEQIKDFMTPKPFTWKSASRKSEITPGV